LERSPFYNLPFGIYQESHLGRIRHPYGELLQLKEWQDKRNEVADIKCSVCGKQEEAWVFFMRGHSKVHPTFQLHHKYYVMTSLPWDYPSEAFQTVCATCHTNIHETTIVPVYANAEMRDAIQAGANVEVCDRCNGEKIFPQWRHVEGGVCFKCRGLGFLFYYSA